MIELIQVKDVIIWHTKLGLCANPGRQTKRRTNRTPTQQNARNRFRCFNCGHKEGQWTEVFVNGRIANHFLCNECRQTHKYVIT